MAQNRVIVIEIHEHPGQIKAGDRNGASAEYLPWTKGQHVKGVFSAYMADASIIGNIGAAINTTLAANGVASFP